MAKPMPIVEVRPVAPKPEPTLGVWLRGLASAQWPGRFYQLLQLSAPAGLQLWAWGWVRSAGWMAAISAFGIWALCQQAVEQDLEEGVPGRARGIWLRIGRRSAGLVAGALALGLMGEAFVRLLSKMFNCPGCAG
jgi:hypothetical protein